MARILDSDWNTPDDDKGPHYDPVRVIVEVTIERDTFGRVADAQESAAKVLTDAIQQLNDEFGSAHSVRPVIHMGMDDGYTDNEVRAAWGEALLAYVGGMTGVARESAFSDAVSYLLHAELLREHESSDDPERVRLFADDMARDLLDVARESFAGDREDGPYSWEPVEDEEE